MANRTMLRKLAASLMAVIAVVAVIEGATRYAEAARRKVSGEGVQALMRSLAEGRIEGRELGNQMLVHNVALFARHPAPQTVKTAYVGTSRTKVLRPAWSGEAGAVNGSGNTYNEISYGLLLQAEVLRLRFPNLKRVYVESSLLLRRPARVIVEDDHRKYVPLLETLLPLRDQLPEAAKFRAELESARGEKRKKFQFEVAKQRSQMRLSSLLGSTPKSVPVSDDPLLRQLDSAGERREAPPPGMPKEQWRAEIKNDNVKVQRMRKIASWAPWDGLFDMVALWGKAHGIEVVLFQPPVRSDLYRYQVEGGLAAHVADLQRVARQYDVQFIDLNTPALGYMDDWALFSDEDHLETCPGVVLLTAALQAGVSEFQSSHQLLPVITRRQAEREATAKLGKNCLP